jgi:hypothetical protein
MKTKNKPKIHVDKKGRQFIKRTYFVRGKMKIAREYVINGIPAMEFYQQNATNLDFYLNGDYELIQDEDDDLDIEIDSDELPY